MTLAFGETVVSTWGVMAVLACASFVVTRSLSILRPGLVQSASEGIVMAIEEAIADVAPEHVDRLLPLIGTIWIYLGLANLLGLVPHLHAPTRDLSQTAALAVVVFFSIHWFGIRELGFRQYLQHYLMPSPWLLPFHVIGEMTRTIALAVRLFGNIMSLEMAALLVVLVAGLLVPVPLLLLHVIEALVQAYIFGMLTLIYVGSALQRQKHQQRGGGEND